MSSGVERANLLVRQFENTHGRRSWENKDPPFRSKFVEDCIRMVGLLERESESKTVKGLENTLLALRNGEGKRLGVNEVNEDDIQVIAKTLKTNTSLLGLRFLWGCKIGPDGARHLSEALRENSTLMSLDVGGYEIGPDGAQYISVALRENSTLLYLYIQSCGIGLDGARHVSDMLKENSSLLYLDIGNNQIGPDGARHVSNMLKENSTLLYLLIYDNQIGPDGAQHLSDALPQNSTLLSLNISSNDINNKELEDSIENDIKSRTSNNKSIKRSFDECRAFLGEYLDHLSSSLSSGTSDSTPSTSAAESSITFSSSTTDTPAVKSYSSLSSG